MASTSNHYGDVAIWIEKVIDSCETPLQEVTARKLVRLFEKKYSYLDYPVYRDLCRRLECKLDDKTYSRLEKKFNPDEFTQQQNPE
jgi:hypothetical protein